MDEALCRLSLVDAAAGLAAGKFSSVELTQACLARAVRLQERFNAFIHVDAEGALAGARRADRARAAGRARGPLWGVPLAAKDTYYRRGRVATCGSLIRRDFVPDHTATTLARLDRAGAVDLGGLNTSDSGCNPFGLNRLVGRARNPWDPERVTGGSSSGSAAAVAARLAFGSLGSDSGGSIRLPAAMCGVVGLKPTEGRISRHGIMPLSFTLDSPGPLARSVADCALIAAAISGRDPRDPATSRAPVADYARTLDAKLKGRRIGVPRNYFYDGIRADLERPVRRSLEVFRRLGAELVEVEVADAALMETLGNVVILAEGARVHRRWLRERAADYTPITRQAVEFGLTVSAVQYLEALTFRARALAAFRADVLSKVDVLHTPVTVAPTPTMAEVEAYLRRRGRLPFDLSRNTKPANYLGLPALSVPCGFSAEGLPVGFQLIGRPFDEALLFNLGHAFQSVTDHHRREPPPG